MAVVGGPVAKTGGFIVGMTGNWISGANVKPDLFAKVVAPAIPIGTPPPAAGVPVGSGVDGCLDTGGCRKFVGGFYPGGINVIGTAIFDPGVYYVQGEMSLGPNSCVQPSTAPGDGSGGTVFYFADNQSIYVGANAGKKCPLYDTSGFGRGKIRCTTTLDISLVLPATINGSVLLAPCSGPYGDPLGASNPLAVQRGLLFFQNRSQSVTANWSGGGAGTGLGDEVGNGGTGCNSGRGLGAGSGSGFGPGPGSGSGTGAGAGPGMGVFPGITIQGGRLEGGTT